MKRPFVMLIAAAMLQAFAVHGQDLFRVKLNGKSAPGTSGKSTTKFTQRNLIAQCVGTGFTDQQLDHDFALVYNSTADSIQVVNEADGSPVCDVFLFQGGSSTATDNELKRLAFVFSPDQADSIGSALIKEKASPSLTSGKNPQAKIQGKIQFTTTKPLADLTHQSTTTATNQTDNTTNEITNTESSNTDTNAENTSTTTSVTDSGVFAQKTALANATTASQVCEASFSVGKLFVAGANLAKAKKPSGTSTNATEEVTTTETTTTTETGTTGTMVTGTTETPGTTNAAPIVVTTNTPPIVSTNTTPPIPTNNPPALP